MPLRRKPAIRSAYSAARPCSLSAFTVSRAGIPRTDGAASASAVASAWDRDGPKPWSPAGARTPKVATGCRASSPTSKAGGRGMDVVWASHPCRGEQELEIETHEELPLRGDSVVRHRVLRLGEEIDGRPTRKLPHLAAAETERDVVVAPLEIEVPGGRAPEIERLRQVVNDEWLRLQPVLRGAVIHAGERMLICHERAEESPRLRRDGARRGACLPLAGDRAGSPSARRVERRPRATSSPPESFVFAPASPPEM